MDELKTVISQNLIKYRKAAGLTQAELAEKINYSDKAVSKWERGDGTPDAMVLKQLAEIFGVTVDDLMNESPDNEPVKAKRKIKLLTKTNVTICSVVLVWLVATVIFVFALLIAPEIKKMWLVFIFAVPVSCIVLLVFNCIWGKNYLFIPIISGLIWSFATGLYLSISLTNSWLFFIICIPLELLTIIYFSLRGKGEKKSDKTK